MFVVVQFAIDNTMAALHHSWIEDGTKAKWVPLPSKKLKVFKPGMSPLPNCVTYKHAFHVLQAIMMGPENIKKASGIVLVKCNGRSRFHGSVRQKKTVLCISSECRC